jgi:hypothetical protein
MGMSLEEIFLELTTTDEQAAGSGDAVAAPAPEGDAVNA